MSKPTKVWVNYGETIQPAKFESIRIDYGLEMTVDDGDDASDMLEAMRRTLKKKVKAALKADIKEW